METARGVDKRSRARGDADPSSVSMHASEARRIAVELSNFGYVEKASGRLDVAEARVLEAIRISLSIRNTYVLAHNLVALAAILAAGGRAEEAARLLGKADAIFAETGLVLDPADKPEYDAAVAAAQAALGDEAYNRAYAGGVELDPAAL